MTHQKHKQPLHHHRGFQAWGEPLEPRTFLTGITVNVVTTLNSVDLRTLRNAILTVDNQGSPTSPNTIDFQIPTSDPGYNPANSTFTISPTSELPPITRPVILDGTSEAGFIGQPAAIAIDGRAIKGSADGLILASGSDGSTIDGLEIAHFSDSGILVQSVGNTIGGTTAGMGNIIGPNTSSGVTLVAPGNAPTTSAGANVLVGNFIGTNTNGDNLGNLVGVAVENGSNTIGGITTAAANVIGFNTLEGVLVSGPSATSNVVEGNFIGTDANGANLGNPTGIVVDSGGNTIGGTTTGAANIIGFNSAAGVLTQSGPNVVEGNFIGTDANGANLGNLQASSWNRGKTRSAGPPQARRISSASAARRVSR